MADDQRTRWWPTEAVLLALAPAAGYYLVFAYQREGTVTTFGIPHALISPTPTTVLEFTAALVAATLVVFWLTHANHPHHRTSFIVREHSSSGYRRERFPLLVMGLFYLAGYRFAYTGWLLLAALLSFVLVFDLLPALFGRRRHGSLDAALNSQLGRLGQAAGGIVWPSAGTNGLPGLDSAVYACMAVTLSSQLGRAEAERQERFLVPDRITNVVVARIYGNQAICVGVELETSADPESPGSS